MELMVLLYSNHMEKLHIPIVLGTARVGRSSQLVSDYIAKVVGEDERVSTEIVDVKEHVKEATTVPSWGEGGSDKEPTRWLHIIERSAGLILIIPEYNHGYPGELKLLLDSLYGHYKGLAVGIVGVSAGTLGGARVIDHIKPVLIELNMHPIKVSVNFSGVKNAFSEDGEIVNDKTTEYVRRMVDELVTLANALKPVRKVDKKLF